MIDLFGNLWLYIVAAASAIAGAVGLYLKGRSDENARRKVGDLEKEVQTNERINRAETGANLSDDERRKRLHKFAERHGKRR